MSEFEWIETYFAPLAGDGSFALKDDAAILDIPTGQQLIITTDTLNEGVHFIAGSDATLLAQKALRVNLSDLAAMGASPLGYTLNLSLNNTHDETWIQAFCHGLKADQQQYSITLLGGDTTRIDGALSITITAYGTVPKGAVLLRSGAQPGDNIYMTGTLGEGYLGLQNFSESTRAHYNRPTPRVILGEALRGIASACMDISDGLAQDIGHICKASNAGATLEAAKLPFSPDAQKWMQQGGDITKLIGGGDEYELLFTAPDTYSTDIASLAQNHAIAITPIGKITDGNEVHIVDGDGQPLSLTQAGWQHF